MCFITLIVFLISFWHEYISSFGASSHCASNEILNVAMESVSKLWPRSKPEVHHILVNLHCKKKSCCMKSYQFLFAL